MRAVPIALSLALVLAVPLTTACYPPRIESCRGPTSDFASVEEVRLIDVTNELAFEIASGEAGYRVEAPGLVGSCIAVHSELLQDGEVIHTLDTTVVVRDERGVPTSSRLHHYRSGDAVRVTTLGRTIEAGVRSSIDRFDAGVPDAGPFDAGLFDAGGSPPDASIDDAPDVDAGVGDAGIEDDAAVDDAG